MKTIHDTFGGISRRADGLCALRPAMPQGFMDATMLARVAEVVRDFGLPGIRATGAQRIEMYGIAPEVVDAVARRIGDLDGACPFMLTLCLGRGQCDKGLQDTRAMAARLEAVLKELTGMGVRPKFGISGCPRGCGQSYVRDVGLLGDAKGWTLLFGGSAGRKARPGQVVAKGLDADAVLSCTGRILDFFSANVKKGERAAGFVERVGMDAVRHAAGIATP